MVGRSRQHKREGGIKRRISRKNIKKNKKIQQNVEVCKDQSKQYMFQRIRQVSKNGYFISALFEDA